MTVDSAASDPFNASLASGWLRISKFGDRYTFNYSAVSYLPNADVILSDANEKLSTVVAQKALLCSWRRFAGIFVDPEPSVDLNETQSPTKRRTSVSQHGRHSPAVNSFAGEPPSPGTVQRSSSFEGDKRSYNILNCLAKDFMKFSKIKEIHSITAEVLKERTELFLSMLHHRMRDVRTRSSPTKENFIFSSVSRPTVLCLFSCHVLKTSVGEFKYQSLLNRKKFA
jgi:hypothetical protein